METGCGQVNASTPELHDGNKHKEEHNTGHPCPLQGTHTAAEAGQDEESKCGGTSGEALENGFPVRWRPVRRSTFAKQVKWQQDKLKGAPVDGGPGEVIKEDVVGFVWSKGCWELIGLTALTCVTTSISRTGRMPMLED